MWSGKAVSSNTGLKLCKKKEEARIALADFGGLSNKKSTRLQDRVVQRWAETEPGLEWNLNSDRKAKNEIIQFDSFRLQFDDWIR